MLYPWGAPAAFFLLLIVLRLCNWFFAQGLQNPHEYDPDDQLHHRLGQRYVLHGSVCGMHFL